MPRTIREKTFSSALVPFVLALVRASGGDSGSLERRYLRAKPADGNALPEISLTDLNALLADASKELNDPLFGLHCAIAMPRGAYGVLEFALRSAPTGRRAIEQLAEYGALINPLVRWSLELDGDEVALHHRAPRKEGVGRQGNYFTVARILAISRQMLGDDLMPTRAWFAHVDKDCPEELRTHLGTARIDFGRSSNGLSFKAADLERTPEGADVELNLVLEKHAKALLRANDAEDIFERTRRTVAELLPRSDASLSKTAKRLHLTSRTLQRRLTEEGVAFADLVAEVRRTQAERLLHKGEADLSEVAGAVGYQDTGAFVRAFKKWTGTTPGKFREQCLNEPVTAPAARRKLA